MSMFAKCGIELALHNAMVGAPIQLSKSPNLSRRNCAAIDSCFEPYTRRAQSCGSPFLQRQLNRELPRRFLR